MYPLTVIRVARGHPITVQLKGGTIYKGILFKCDLWMNIHLKYVYKDGEKAYKECYIKGTTIKQIQCDKKHLTTQEILQKRRK